MAQDTQPVVADSLKDQLTDRAGNLPESQKVSLQTWQVALKYLIPLLFAVVLIIPGYTYFVVNDAGSLLFGEGITPEIRFYTLFRLFGLYALVFLWGQIMLGPFMQPLNRLYGKNWLYFHRTQGLFALLLAFLHPPILYTAYYVQTGTFNPMLAVEAYAGDQSMYAYLGMVALLLLLLTVFSAMMMRKPWMQKHWRKIHLLNYVVFLLVLVHALKLGSEIQVMPMQLLYWLMAVTFLLSVGYRRVYRPLITKRMF